MVAETLAAARGHEHETVAAWSDRPLSSRLEKTRERERDPFFERRPSRALSRRERGIEKKNAPSGFFRRGARDSRGDKRLVERVCL